MFDETWKTLENIKHCLCNKHSSYKNTKHSLYQHSKDSLSTIYITNTKHVFYIIDADHSLHGHII